MFLAPTLTYLAYANQQVAMQAAVAQSVFAHTAILHDNEIEVHERSLEYGLSTYDYHADGKGVETEAPLAERFEIGAFSAEPGKKGYRRDSVLLLERRPLQSGRQDVRLVLDRAPAFVGVDPFNVRIDRNSNDNVVKVE